MQKIEYVYVKPRGAFGKQCVFEESGPTIEENIAPEPELTREFVQRNYTHKEAQNTEQFALHEAQTTIVSSKNSGMSHTEGGWPKEINFKDEEVTARFRRRVEKEDRWGEKIPCLFETMDASITQNNAVNIYDYYFDDMIPTSLTLSYDVRTLNVYTDPNFLSRPVRNLSWSPNGGDRLAGAYSFTEFEESVPNVSPESYIWDIENPNKALMTMQPTSPMMALEFNPRDPWMLVSGLSSGQVCNWDTRIGDGPVQISHRQFSHRSPATQTLWIASKTNSEFFSASTDGTIKWWDIRNLRRPKDVIVMDLEDPQRADIVKAIGISALQFESTMGSKFMAGTDNGIVISGNKKGNTPAERIQLRFNSYTGPVLAVDRNPFSPKNFLTVGDWTAKIWAEDTREGSLLTTGNEDAPLSGGCWSRSRFSVFFTISTKGVLQIYDIMRGIDRPVIAMHLCDDILTSIRPHEDGQLLAVGSHQGCIYLVECSDGLTMTSDRMAVTNYLDICSRYAKATDNRLKEMRVLRVSSHYQFNLSMEDMPGETRKGKGKRKSTVKEKPRFKIDEPVGKDKKALKKAKPKHKKESSVVGVDPRLAETEKEFFITVEAEAERIGGTEDLDKDQVNEVMQEMVTRTRRTSDVKREAVEAEKARRAEEKARKKKEKMKKTTSKASIERGSETKSVREESIVVLDLAPSPGKPRRRKEKYVKSCKMEVCKPEICCKDVVAEAKKRATLKSPEQDLKDECEFLPYGGIILTKDALPGVLVEEVEDAKKHLREWQEELIAGKQTFRLARDESVVVPEQPSATSLQGPTVQEEPPRPSALVLEERKEAREKEKVQWSKKKEEEKTKSPVRRRSKKHLIPEETISLVGRRPDIDWSEPTVKKILARDSVIYPRISAAYVRGIDEETETEPRP